MDAEDLAHQIPTMLDVPDKFLLWDRDVAAILLGGIVLGILCELPITGAVFGLTGAFIYKKIKTGKHPGMSLHLGYWIAGAIRVQSLAPSHVREFNG